MSRDACVTALVEVLADLPDFTFAGGGAVAAYDNRIVASGVQQALVVSHLRGEYQPRLFSWDWYLALDLWVRTNNRLDEARAKASELVDAILVELRANAQLDDRVTEAEASETRLVAENAKFGRGVYYREEITVRVRERVGGSG